MDRQSFLAAADQDNVKPIWYTDIGWPLMGSPCPVSLESGRGVVFGYGGRSGSHGGIVMLDVETGEEMHRLEVGAGVEGGVAPVGDGVVFGDQQGGIHCLDLARGQVKWAAAVRGAVAATPRVISDLVYVATSVGEIAILDGVTGRVQKTAQLTSSLVSTQPVHVAQEARPLASHLSALRDALAGCFDLDEVEDLCFDLEIDFEQLVGKTHTAKVRELLRYLERRQRLAELLVICQKRRPDIAWATLLLPIPPVDTSVPPRLGRPSRRLAPAIVSTPTVLPDGTVVVGALDGGVYAYEPAPAKVRRVVDASASVYTTPQVHDPGKGEGVWVIVGTSLGTLLAVDVDTGKEAWRQSFAGPIRATPTLVVDTEGDALYVGGHDHALRVVDPGSGSVRRRFAWERSVVNSPLVVGELVVFADSGGKVVVIDQEKREVVWRFDAELDKPGLNGMPAAVFGRCLLDGPRLICGSYNGRAYALPFATN